MSETGTDNGTEHTGPWYANKREITIQHYRINRRPLVQQTIFQRPDDFFDHLVEVLLFGQRVDVPGRGQRTWILGNSEIAQDESYLAGEIGYETPSTSMTPIYDEQAQEWIEEEQPAGGASSPFMIWAESQTLSVFKHPSFSEAVSATVIQKLLNDGESQRAEQSTEWAVEPELDSDEFEEWLSEIDKLDHLKFHVRLPNPDGEEHFQFLLDHMDGMDAREFTHTLKPRSEQGLSKDLGGDRITSGLRAMAERSYAQVTAKGRTVAGALKKFSQRQSAKRTYVPGPSNRTAANEVLAETSQSMGSKE